MAEATSSGPGVACPPFNLPWASRQRTPEFLVRARLVAMVEHVRLEAGLDGAGLDDQHLDPEMADFKMQRLGQSLEGKLRGRVVAAERWCRDPGGRRHVDDRPAAALTHRREERLDHAGCAEHICLEHSADFREGRGFDGAFEPEAGVVDEDIDRTGCRERVGDRVVTVDIEGQGLVDLETVERFEAAGGRDHLVPASRQLDGSGPADAG